MPTILTTQRLILRPLVVEDAGALTILIADYAVSKWLTHVPHPYALDDALWFINSDGNTPGQNWAIEKEGDLVGVIGIGQELGYWLGRAHWRQGIMSEAARAVVDAAFQSTDRPDITSGYFLDNAGSRAILTGLGFTNTQTETVHSKSQGQTVALQRVRLTRQAWQTWKAQNG